MAASNSSSGLCFLEASKQFQAKRISEEEYYRHILAHCTGYLHEEDDDIDLSPSLSLSSLYSTDPFAYAVQCFMKRKDFVKDISPFEDAFKALDKQDVQAIQEAAGKVDNQPHQEQIKKFFHKILAFRALQLRKAKVLKYCLDVGGFPYESYFEDEADDVREEEDPLTFKVLEESHFRRLYPRKSTNAGDGEDDDGFDIDASDMSAHERDRRERERAAATFDKDGEFPVDW
ncbi:hypothetical protein V8F20_009881 [Naviculisporaceae sp. PSN 640]